MICPICGGEVETRQNGIIVIAFSSFNLNNFVPCLQIQIRMICPKIRAEALLREEAEEKPSLCFAVINTFSQMLHRQLP